MKDADEGTKFEDVQTASVKWNLANDSNNRKLSNVAMKEMIGHLSKENKEPYLKDVQPLQTYIDAKDEFDYKNNNYTTTENIDTTPHEGVRSIQRKLNEKGYTDKFGNALKEDGVYGGKTAYALDEFEKNVTKNSNNKYKTAIIGGKEYQVEYPVATREDLQPKMLNNSKDGLADVNYEINTVSNDENASRIFGNRFNSPVRTGERPGAREASKNREKAEIKLESKTYINENGITKWKELPYVAQRIPVEEQLFRERKISTEVYKAFDTLSQRWYYADTQEERDRISGLSKSIRENDYSEHSCMSAMNKLYGNEGIITAGYKDGVWYKDYDFYEFGDNSDTYKILLDLNNRWKISTASQKQELKNTGDEARRLSRTGTPIMYGQDAIIKLLHDNQETAKEYQETFNNLVLKNPTIASPYTWFVAMTCSEWDYKRNSDWQVPYETFNGENMNNDNRKNWTPWIYFDGMLISADKLGNINLGYIGTKMGFSDVQLKNSYTMDKDDGPYVEYGIKMAEQGR